MGEDIGYSGHEIYPSGWDDVRRTATGWAREFRTRTSKLFEVKVFL